MDAVEMWNRIIERAKTNSFEVHTVPLNKKTPLWFQISTDGNSIIVNPARDNEPSSTFKMPRIIKLREFKRIFPYYDLRLKGTSVSQETANQSVNTVYIYGLIADALSNRDT